jgi:hypothetical protein
VRRFETLHLALAPSCGLVRFSARLFIRKPCSWRADNPISELCRAVRAQIVVHKNIGFLSSLRMSFTAAA